MNRISLSNNHLNFSINHSYYNTDNIILNNLGDLDFVISNTESFRTQKNFDFKLGFCPLGYNKNNYIIDLNFYKNLDTVLI